MSSRRIPPAVFLPPAFETLPDPADWLRNDKHLVLTFRPADLSAAAAYMRELAVTR